jgi:hypothetical protein
MKQTIEIEIPDGYELAGQFTSTEGDKIIGIGFKLKPVKINHKLMKCVLKNVKELLLNSTLI